MAFQQDNDLKHTKNFLRDNMPKVMTGPSNSLDSNPTENLCNDVRRNEEKKILVIYGVLWSMSGMIFHD